MFKKRLVVITAVAILLSQNVYATETLSDNSLPPFEEETSVENNQVVEEPSTNTITEITEPIGQTISYEQQNEETNKTETPEENVVSQNNSVETLPAFEFEIPEAIESDTTLKKYASLSASPTDASYQVPSTTVIKNQGTEGYCWAFAETAAMEQSAITNCGLSNTFNLSTSQYIRTNHTHIVEPRGGTTGDTTTWSGTNKSNNPLFTMWTVASGVTPVQANGTDNTSNENKDYADIALEAEDIKLINITDTTSIKQSIIDYGGVTGMVTIESGDSDGYYYQKGTSLNHEILIIGWDDNKSKNLFTNSSGQTPTNNGAWYIKNSWGTGTGLSGYGWLSYEDGSLTNATLNRCVAYRMMTKAAANTANIYEYDGCCNADTYNGSQFTNIFTASGSGTAESIDSVGVGIYTPGTYIVTVTCGSASSTKTFTMTNAGYKRVFLTTPIVVAHNRTFSVTVRKSTSSSFQMFVDTPYSWVDGGNTLMTWEPVSTTGQFTIDGKDVNTVGNKTPRIKAFTSTVSVTPTNINDATIAFNQDSYYYTGSQIKPSFTLRDANGATIDPSNYIVYYGTNRNVGYGTVQVVGNTGLVTGSKIFRFIINQADINNTDAEILPTYKARTGQPVTLTSDELVVTYNGTRLTLGNDYTVTYNNNVNVGTATVTLVGMNKFTGSKTLSFEIIDRLDIKDAVISPIPAQVFTGSEITLQSGDLVVKYGPDVLVEGTDFTTIYSNNTKKGTATVLIKGKGAYYGEQTATFKIVGKIAPDKLVQINTKKFDVTQVPLLFKGVTYKAQLGFKAKKVTVSDTSILKASKNGSLKPKNPGRTRVVFENGSQSVSMDVYVENPTLPKKKTLVSVSNSSINVLDLMAGNDYGEPTKITASNKKSVSVDAVGNVTFTKNGSSTVTVFYGAKKVKCKIIRKAAAINKSRIKIKVNQSYQLKIKNNPEKKVVSWSTADKTVALVNTDGTVKGINEGETIVYALIDGTLLKCNVEVNGIQKKEED